MTNDLNATVLVHPDYYKTIRRDAASGKWFTYPTELFCSGQKSGQKRDYGVSNKQLITELFRINGGRTGYYLADLCHKQYYYCGMEPEGVRSQLLNLGSGREHPKGM